MSVEQTLKELSFGSMAGIAGKFIEYPFDKIKVRLQCETRHSGPIECFRTMIKVEGWKNIYRGISAPLVGAIAENASLFMIYSRAKTALESNIYHCKLPISGLVAAVAISGLASSFILTPIELIKCKLQVQIIPTSSTAAPFCPPGAFALCIQTYRNHGIPGFWRGHLGTLVRETGGSAAWFGIYEYTTMLCRQQTNCKNTASEMMLAGALSGMGYNLVLFPADSIKSRMQTNATCNMLQTVCDIWKCFGIKGFYRGCGITVARSAPSSAIIFLVFTKLVEFDKEME